MSGAALTIIGEYAYLLWDQDHSISDGCVAAAVNLYKGSMNYNTVIQAVDEVFRKSKFDEDHHTIMQKLLEIAMDNRFCRSNAWSK